MRLPPCGALDWSTVHDRGRPYDLTPEDGSDRLLSKADTKNWQLSGKVFYDAHRYTRLFRRAGPRRNTDGRGGKLFNIFQLNLVDTRQDIDAWSGEAAVTKQGTRNAPNSRG